MARPKVTIAQLLDRLTGTLQLEEIDATAAVIRTMRRLRLAWNVVEITPERQRQKLA